MLLRGGNYTDNNAGVFNFNIANGSVNVNNSFRLVMRTMIWNKKYIS